MMGFGSFDFEPCPVCEGVDYKVILHKYVALIVSAEGVHFVRDHHKYNLENQFTDEEWGALKAIAKEHPDMHDS